MQRLSLEKQHQRYVQQTAWTKPLRDYLFPQLQLSKHSKILEVGCGTGALFSHLADFFSAKLFGIDLHAPSLRYAQTQPYTSLLCQADGLQLPFASNSFELCLCHFLLLWVANPLQILREMRRVACPKGTVLTLAEPDYGGRIDEPPSLQTMGNLQRKAVEQQGANVLIGRRVKGLMFQAGFNTVESGVLGGQWKSSTNQAEQKLEWETFQHDVQDLLSADELQRLKEMENQAYCSGERVLFIPTFYAAAKKE